MSDVHTQVWASIAAGALYRTIYILIVALRAIACRLVYVAKERLQ